MNRREAILIALENNLNTYWFKVHNGLTKKSTTKSLFGSRLCRRISSWLRNLITYEGSRAIQINTRVTNKKLALSSRCQYFSNNSELSFKDFKSVFECYSSSGCQQNEYRINSFDYLENLFQVERDLEFLGLVIMENRLKAATTGIIRELKEANIHVVMITG